MITEIAITSGQAVPPQNRLDSGEEEIAVSDGREEREEEEKRREREKRKDREDWIDRDLKDQWEPERVDS